MTEMRNRPGWMGRLRLPVIAAPMLGVSGPELVTAACRAGVVGAFPTANARSAAELAEWLGVVKSGIGPSDGPAAANLIMRSPRFEGDLAALVTDPVELVITSVGAPGPAVEPLHSVGTSVFADVATLHHARRAVEAGADGLILLTAGAGGQTGWLNPFAFVRAVRQFFDGPLVLAGGVSDGHSLRAAQVLGCDLAYLGTSFLATEESRAQPDYKRMLVESSIDDVVLTSTFSGLPTSMLGPSIRAAGLDPANLPARTTPQDADAMYGHGATGPRRWTNIWSAGHSVSGVQEICGVQHLVDRLHAQYEEAGIAP